MAGDYVSAERIAAALGGGKPKRGALTLRGTVEAAAGGTASVRLDGAPEGEVTACADYCGAGIGDRVAVTVLEDGRCIAVAKRGGGGGSASVAWGDIAGKPAAFPPANHAHAWNAITDKPAAFPAAAHGHKWTDLTDAPTTMRPTPHGHVWGEITDAPATMPPTAHKHLWGDLTGVPATFPPAPHTHPEISGSDIDSSGTSGIWSWVKYTDGRVHLLGREDWAPSGGGWQGHYIAKRTVALPMRLASVLYASVSVFANGSNIVFGSVATVDATSLAYYHSSMNNVIDGTSSFEVWGRWK